MTIPPLPDERQWLAYEQARTAMLPNVMQVDPAVRYRAAA